MITRLTLRLLLVPLFVVAMPLIFSLAWIGELLEDLSLRGPPPL
jgi:uncharacterized MAPEG superfamily protein